MDALVNKHRKFIRLGSEPARVRVALTQRFYDEIYQAAFPKRDQAEGPETWLPLMGLEGDIPPGQPSIEIILACGLERRILGGVIFEHYRASDCWLATYLVVRPECRRQGIASGLVSEVAHAISKQHGDEWLLFAETEEPSRLPLPEEHRAANERLRALDALGFRRVPIDYVQPPLGPGKRPLNDLQLLCYTSNEEPIAVDAARLLRFLQEFYAALEQPGSPYLTSTAEALSMSDKVNLRRLAV